MYWIYKLFAELRVCIGFKVDLLIGTNMNRYFFSSILYLKMLRSSGILLLLLLCISSFNPAFGGDIVIWGESGVNDRAQEAGSDFIAVAAGAVHSLALRADGRIAIWDDSETAQNFESFDNNYIAIAAGGFHSWHCVRMVPFSAGVRTGGTRPFHLKEMIM
jgi:hypothetical protein